jgi:hypothetical protein
MVCPSVHPNVSPQGFEVSEDEVIAMVYVLVGAMLGALIVGWLSGMVTFKRSQSWCPACGSRLSCADCPRAGLHRLTADGGRRR